MTKHEQIEQKTEKLVQPLLDQMNFELVDVEYVKEAGTYYLRVYIDKEGGITVDDCEVISRALSDILDRDDYINDSYIFEVSSPGLERPLKKQKDYIRNKDKEVLIRTYQAIEGEKEFVGLLHDFDEVSVTLAFDEDTTLTFEKANIALIREYVDFDF